METPTPPTPATPIGATPLAPRRHHGDMSSRQSLYGNGLGRQSGSFFLPPSVDGSRRGARTELSLRYRSLA